MVNSPEKIEALNNALLEWIEHTAQNELQKEALLIVFGMYYDEDNEEDDPDYNPEEPPSDGGPYTAPPTKEEHLKIILEDAYLALEYYQGLLDEEDPGMSEEDIWDAIRQCLDTIDTVRKQLKDG